MLGLLALTVLAVVIAVVKQFQKNVVLGIAEAEEADLMTETMDQRMKGKRGIDLTVKVCFVAAGGSVLKRAQGGGGQMFA